MEVEVLKILLDRHITNKKKFKKMPKRREQRPEDQQPQHSQPQEKPEGGGVEHKK